jgi:hypothetical protein
MRISPKHFLHVYVGVFSISLFAGCSSIGGEVAGRMTKKNEQDLKTNRQSPKEYRERRDEIDRNLK